jgi:hypothetical protein
MPATDLQEHQKVVGPSQGIGTTAFPWISVLPLRFPKPAASDHDSGSASDCWFRPAGNSCGRRRNSGTSIGNFFWDAQTALALPRSRTKGTSRLREFNGPRRNSGERKRQPPRGAVGDAASTVCGFGSRHFLAVPGQGSESRESGTTDSPSGSRVVRKPTRVKESFGARQ